MESPAKNGKRVAVVGLGRMGGLMAKHLVDQGYEVTGYDPAEAAVAAAAENGVKTMKSVPEAVAEAEVICSSLPSPDTVRDVYLGSGRALDSMQKHAAAFELSTSSVGLAREIYAEAKKRNVHFLDTPVSGSVPHLEKRQVSAMAGGDQKVLKKHEDVLLAFSKSVTYMGAAGNGLLMKLVTNHILGVHHAGIAEGLAWGMKAGLDPAEMVKFLQGSAVALLLQYKAPTMAARDYSDVIASVEISRKDLGLSIEEANHLAAPVPLGVAARQQYISAAALGMGEADFNAVFEAYLNSMGVPPKRP